MANVVFNRFPTNLMNKEIDLDADTIKVGLLTDSYTPDKDHDLWGDVSANEVSGTGYTAGGATLANTTVVQDDANDLAYFDSDNPAWSTATITARYAVLYDDTVADDPLIALWDFTEDKTSTAGTFTITVPATGWFKIEQGS